MSASAVDHAGTADLVNGRSLAAVSGPVFRQVATSPLGDTAPGGDPHCYWPPPPTYNGPITPVTQRQLSERKELLPTQKTGDGVGGTPFYSWMTRQGWYIYKPPCTQPQGMRNIQKRSNHIRDLGRATCRKNYLPFCGDCPDAVYQI